MRIMLLAALGVALAGCGEGSGFDQGFKTSFREKFVSSCVEGARGSAPAGVAIDFDRVCGCTADKVMQGKSATQLMTEKPGAADIAKLKQCVTELYPQGVQAAGRPREITVPKTAR